MIYDSFWRLDIVAQTNENSRFEPKNPGGNVGRAPENAGTLPRIARMKVKGSLGE